MLFISATSFAQLTIKSADGVDVEVDDTSRIITVGGSITETVFALGAGSQVVATDRSSTYPAEVFRLPRVPYVRTLTPEGILSLNPTLVLATDDAEPKVVIDQLREAGLDIVLIEEGTSHEKITSKIKQIGKILGKSEHAAQIVEENDLKFEEAKKALATVEDSPKVLFILAQQGPSQFMVAGNGTEAEAIITYAGGTNAFSEFKGYKPVTSEALLAANPDFILFMESRREALPEDMTKVPILNLTTAVQKDQIIAMDGNLLLGFGPRFGEAVSVLMNHIHPNLNKQQ